MKTGRGGSKGSRRRTSPKSESARASHRGAREASATPARGRSGRARASADEVPAQDREMAAESGTAMAPVEADAEPAVLGPDAALRELPRDGALEDVAVRQADDMVGDEEPG